MHKREVAIAQARVDLLVQPRVVAELEGGADAGRQHAEKVVERGEVLLEGRRELKQQRASRGPSSAAASQNARSGSATSRSLRSCVMRRGAFSVKRKSAGTCAAQPVTSLAVGIR